jgi:hypothetical protein
MGPGDPAPCASAFQVPFRRRRRCRRIGTGLAVTTSIMENQHPFVRTASWLASLSAAGGDTRSAESYILGILAWYVTSGGTLLLNETRATAPS